ncbi:hypothetical protein DICPUDRAFT_157788 [Dictyostelium purpureum]|uniref:Uncharacterized protein n=1 Tax=Dictyostelium purpureum TaxID=5786 RepID=F1A003_DICPU|nr:uncharacterized protein DICPUDRAFT_157788 [Dictyostelium purpureum]EGC30472.1 hypothetical protein DICPUDRAFT_157788 [Dictyostelium purpureum]|eukprot:XP_003293001.1 hypothetical protein DICPUDRAFT_157788 [Dictyostelium purpureum]
MTNSNISSGNDIIPNNIKNEHNEALGYNNLNNTNSSNIGITSNTNNTNIATNNANPSNNTPNININTPNITTTNITTPNKRSTTATNNTKIKNNYTRLPIDISKDSLTDPVNIPSKFKLFQASTNNIGSIFGRIQYNLFDGFRVSARSLDSRIKATYEKPTTPSTQSPPIKFSASWYETPRGLREGDIGVMIPNIYSIYKRQSASVFQVGLGLGLRVHSLSRMIISPFINPRFTYFGKFGWLHLDVPINKKSNRIVLKHNMFFSIRGNTLLSSLEISSRLGDMSRYFSDHYYSNKVFDGDNDNNFSRSTSFNSLRKYQNNNNNNNNNINNNNNQHTNNYSNHNNYPLNSSIGLPTLLDYKNRITEGSRFFEVIHYKLVHVSSATEFGIRRISKLYGTKWQLEIGLKHQITAGGALQSLFTHTIGEKTTFGLSFGFDL